VRFVKLLLSPGPDFIKFRVESSDFRIQVDKTQAGGHDQLLSPCTDIILDKPAFMNTQAEGCPVDGSFSRYKGSRLDVSMMR
jgi:hypothetical protein